jgi:hypothetical protein
MLENHCAIWWLGEPISKSQDAGRIEQVNNAISLRIVSDPVFEVNLFEGMSLL